MMPRPVPFASGLDADYELCCLAYIASGQLHACSCACHVDEGSLTS